VPDPNFRVEGDCPVRGNVHEAVTCLAVNSVVLTRLRHCLEELGLRAANPLLYLQLSASVVSPMLKLHYRPFMDTEKFRVAGSTE
jgi:adenine deaminase